MKACLAAAVAVALVLPERPLAGAAAGERWIGTWFAASTARVDAPAATGAPPATSGQSLLRVSDQTLRQIVHITHGGARLRVVFTNTFGTAGLRIGAASVARRDHDAAIVAASARPLTFDGVAQATIPAGAVLLSDPVNLEAPDFSDLAIDLFLPGDTGAMASPATTHPASWQTSYVSAPGNFAGRATMPVEATTTYRRADGLQSATWFFLTRVEVAAPADAGVIVALGDSITDGTASGLDANHRWPDYLARRLTAAGARVAVLNAGIGGNRLLNEGNGPSALARFDRDVIAQPGVTAVIVLEGINDIGQARQSPSPAAADLIAAHQQIIARAHAHGLRVYGATLTPFEGAAYWTPEGEAKRRQLNEWIRGGQGYDAVFDFDAAVHDPAQPTKTLLRFDAGDHLHLNAAGYEAVAGTIDLAVFASRPVSVR
ncbi:MAG TPA: SGNH/GDSL hydrolase family protein [Vicinamibacterales bacterium]